MNTGIVTAHDGDWVEGRLDEQARIRDAGIAKIGKPCQGRFKNAT